MSNTGLVSPINLLYVLVCVGIGWLLYRRSNPIQGIIQGLVVGIAPPVLVQILNISNLSLLLGLIYGLPIPLWFAGLIYVRSKSKQPRPSVSRSAQPSRDISSRQNTSALSSPNVSPIAPLAAKPLIKIPSGSIFISYRRDDSQSITDRIYDRLKVAFGSDAIFKDVDSIPAGMDFRKVIDKALQQSQVMLVVVGRQWANIGAENGGRPRLFEENDLVRLEVEKALLNSRVMTIPILVHSAHLPTTDQLPPSLQELVYRNALPVRNDPDFDRDIERLIESLRQHIRSR